MNGQIFLLQILILGLTLMVLGQLVSQIDHLKRVSRRQTKVKPSTTSPDAPRLSAVSSAGAAANPRPAHRTDPVAGAQKPVWSPETVE